MLSRKEIAILAMTAFGFTLGMVTLFYTNKDKVTKKKKKLENFQPTAEENKSSVKDQKIEFVIPEIRNAQELGREDAERLTKCLAVTDQKLLARVLTTIANASAFKASQDALRKAGCLKKLQSLAEYHSIAMNIGGTIAASSEVVSNLTLAINNLAMNLENQKELQGCISPLINLASGDNEAVKLSSLHALTNLSITSDYHPSYTQVIQQLYDLLDSESLPTRIKIQALKVLANLSCNPDMVPHLLAARAPKCTLQLLSSETTDVDLILRWTTILANLLQTQSDRQISVNNLPSHYKAASPETMYCKLLGVENNSALKSKVYVLCHRGEEDVRVQATKIYTALTVT